jgi:anaerobic selenocysteine-containing dehydrogenase
MAEEIDTPADDGTRVRALITVAGNPALSSPNAARLEKALDSLEFMVSVDIYLNETTRHADVVLPAPSTLTRSHYDISFTALACRNVVRFSPATLPAATGQRPQSETLLRIAAIAIGNGMTAEALDDLVAGELAGRLVADPQSRVVGRAPEELLKAAAPLRLEDRLLDMMLRAGPYGDGLGAFPDGLNVRMLEQHPHGIDLGPLQPRLPEVLRTPSGRVELAPVQLLDDVPRLLAALRAPSSGLRLVGRRDLRSNNSWMHNIEPMVKGRNRCTLQVNPADADRLGLVHGAPARVQSAAGAVELETEVTDAIREGVVSIPHGWGHDRPDTRIGVATARAGVNSNVLTDETPLDPLSGTAVLNGIPVTVQPRHSAATSPVDSVVAVSPRSPGR